MTAEEAEAIFDTLPDPAGYFYRFHLPESLLRRKARGDGKRQPVGETSQREPA